MPPQAAAAAPPPTVWVVVLGDFGRSPRMQYHTQSLAEEGYRVCVLASPGSPPIAPLLAAPNVSLHYLAPPPPWVAALPSLLGLAAKAALQAALMLWAVLAALPRPHAILMQNPPAIPVMAVLWLAALRHRASLVIDWHNLAYSILALKHGRRRWLIAVARAYERAFGTRGAAHFTVTRAMRAFLASDFGVEATVLYDRPPEAFKRLTDPERAALLQRLLPALRAAAIGAEVLGPGTANGGGAAAAAAAAADGPSAAAGTAAPSSSSPLTRGASARQQRAPDASAAAPFFAPAANGSLTDAPRRPAIVVSSTSWTPDEDFGILLEAAQRYDAAASSSAAAEALYPDVLFVITGRGPQREEYLAKIAALQLRRCAFASVWLEPEDYPALLGAADLGVCLHTSSSGLDLPMKVVDMFGAGLPVCAVRYPCIGELVEDEQTGLLFDSPDQLAEQLERLLRGFAGRSGGGGAELGQMRSKVIEAHGGWRWRENWRDVAAPVIAAACGGAPAGAAAAGGGGGGGRETPGGAAGKKTKPPVTNPCAGGFSGRVGVGVNGSVG